MRVLGISGSLRKGSYNTALLRAAALELPPGAQLEIYGALKSVPPYDEDDDGPNAPAAVRELRVAIATADALVIATPEYNSSIPGQLKNALDWASRPLRSAVLANKPVTVIGSSKGMFGAVWAQAELRKVLAATGARVLGDELPVSRSHEAFDGEGRLTSEELTEALAAQMGLLVAEAAPTLQRS
jgi:chromate reductase